MQKKIIALAIAAAFSAPAFADTTVYGVVDAAVANISASGMKGDTLVLSSGLAGSRLGVKSSEDLSNGMKVGAVLEYAVDLTQPAGAITSATATGTNGSGIGNARQEMVSLSGDFGTVAAGYLQTAAYDFDAKFDPAFGSIASPLANTTKGGGFLTGGSATTLARAPRALAYISPDLSGLTVAVNYSTDTATQGTGLLLQADTNGSLGKTSATLLAATYSGVQNLAVGVVYAATNSTAYGNTATVNSATEYAFGASYDLTVAKLFATYQSNSLATQVGSANTAVSLSATAPVGPGTIGLTYAKNTMNHNATTGADVSSLDTSASGVTLGWFQPLSKTTTFYAAYSTMSQGADTQSYSVDNNVLGGAAALANGTGSNAVAVGLNKKF